MNKYEFITIVIAITSIIVSAVLTFISIRSSNKSTRLLAKLMRENSRTTGSEHLSLFRIEAFYNAVAIRNLEGTIKVLEQKLKKATIAEQYDLDMELKRAKMNLHFMKIREMQLIDCDFTLQKDIFELRKEMKE